MTAAGAHARSCVLLLPRPSVDRDQRSDDPGSKHRQGQFALGLFGHGFLPSDTPRPATGRFWLLVRAPMPRRLAAHGTRTRTAGPEPAARPTPGTTTPLPPCSRTRPTRSPTRQQRAHTTVRDRGTLPASTAASRCRKRRAAGDSARKDTATVPCAAARGPALGPVLACCVISQPSTAGKTQPHSQESGRKIPTPL